VALVGKRDAFSSPASEMKLTADLLVCSDDGGPEAPLLLATDCWVIGKPTLFRWSTRVVVPVKNHFFSSYSDKSNLRRGTEATDLQIVKIKEKNNNG
jgi:hypothetical protein